MKQTYWNSNGRYQATADVLQRLIPAEGSVAEPRKNPALERFRKACNCYYDLYNNGLCNRAREFARVFFASSQYKTLQYGRFLDSMYTRTEACMDQIIEAAAREQGVELTEKLAEAA